MPAVLPALTVIVGIAVGVLGPSLTSAACVALFTTGSIAALAWWLERGRTFLLSVAIAFASAGVLLGEAQVAKSTHSSLREFFLDARAGTEKSLPPLTLEGVIRKDAAPTEYGASMTIEVSRVQTACGWLPVSGGLRVAVTGSLASGRVDTWLAGRRVRMPVMLRPPTTFRDPGVSDEAFGLLRRGIVLAGAVKSSTLVEVVQRGHAAAELAAAIRGYTRRAIAEAIPARPAAAAIVTAILVGDRGGLDADLERRLQEAGTYHVIAISGGNVAILASLSFVLLRLARVPRRAGSLMLALVICAYGYVAGGGASVARATMAAAFYLVASAADHRSPALNVFATVALVAVIYDPLAVFDPGLLLSYGATLALLIGVERVLRRRGSGKAETRGDGRTRQEAGAGAHERPRERGRRHYLSDSLRRLGPSASAAARHTSDAAIAIICGSLAAEVALLPIVASIFHRVTLAGLALNFVAIPLMTLAQIGGIAVLLLRPLSSTLATGAGLVAGLAADGLTRSTELLDVAPWLAWRVPAPPAALVAIYYAGLLTWLLVPRARRLTMVGLLASLCAALLIAWPALADRLFARRSPSEGQLRVTFLDVGQGDSILIQFPAGASLLVDAAGLGGSSFDMGDRVITPALLALGVRRLDYLAITHGDPDHVEGAPSVTRDFAPRELWEGVPVPPHQTLRILRSLVAGRGGGTRLARPDDRVTLGGVELRILHPLEPDWERQRVRNDDSIAMELRYGDVSMVLPGDIGSTVEDSIAPRLSDAPLRILKAAHHGSATSSSETWLRAAHPAAVIFSCGRDNRFGHPAPVVLDRVKSHGAAIFRTDLDGAITVTTDGKSATVRTFTGRVSTLHSR